MIPIRQSVAAVPAAPQARSGPLRQVLSRSIVPWLFVLPILVVHGLVVIGPSLSAVYYSLTDWSGIGRANFVGLDNFRRLLFDDPDYKIAFVNNLLWLAFFLVVPMTLALLAASLLAPVRRGAMFFRIALFIPYVLPSVVTAGIWRNLLNPTLGLGAQLAKLGLSGLDIAFLGNPHTALFAVAFIDNWHFWGFLMVLFLTAMQSIPVDLYDAARIDGANGWQEFQAVTLPGIRPTVVFMLLMTTIWSFLVFDYIYILTQGGPAGSSMVLGVLVIKNAFENYEAGYAAAIGLSMSFLAGLVTLLFVVLRRRGWDL
jgi:raffinose/stachyose/melibiose transport system permease protein